MRRFISILFLLVIGGCINDVLDESYSNVNEAVKDGAITRGWIPEWIPKTAIYINEMHNLDTNQSVLAFEIPIQSSWGLPSQCQSITGNEISIPRYKRNWFPDEFKLKKDFIVYSCGKSFTGNDEFVAISHDGRHALHWRK